MLKKLVPLTAKAAAKASLLALTAGQVMKPGPRHVRDDALAVEAADLMEQHRINQVLVCESNGKLVGALHIHDLTRAKVI